MTARAVHVLALCGSLRAASMNRALLEAAARLAPPGIEVRLFAGLGDLPLFNPDREADLPPPVRALHAQIEAADALLIASPEYAHGVTAVLKNALDWLVSFPPFVARPVAILNASPRSVHADAALREILVTMSADLVVDACRALPLRATGATVDSIVAAHAAEIRDALQRLARGVTR
ncbi:MAG TPA: NADPH-dependent FMN reductase [Steroidobacteraceae bacterium]|nr:NADPH-dependent FMN reductase [Steroidobacteraceae bacterium]